MDGSERQMVAGAAMLINDGIFCRFDGSTEKIGPVFVGLANFERMENKQVLI